MAHEIAHVTARHGVEQASKGTLLQYLSIPLIFVGGLPGMIVQNAANILVPLTFLKFSRGAEEEADRLGLAIHVGSRVRPDRYAQLLRKAQGEREERAGHAGKGLQHAPGHRQPHRQGAGLLVRFPGRDEYTVSTSEFGGVKQKLLSITNQQKLGSEGKSGAPTLKRKPARTDGEGEADKNRLRSSESQKTINGSGANR